MHIITLERPPDRPGGAGAGAGAGDHEQRARGLSRWRRLLPAHPTPTKPANTPSVRNTAPRSPRATAAPAPLDAPIAGFEDEPRLRGASPAPRRMTSDTVAVLRIILMDLDAEWHGFELSKPSGLKPGTMYPIVGRLLQTWCLADLPQRKRIDMRLAASRDQQNLGIHEGDDTADAPTLGLGGFVPQAEARLMRLVGRWGIRDRLGVGTTAPRPPAPATTAHRPQPRALSLVGGST
jgi:hypothetical protein